MATLVTTANVVPAQSPATGAIEGRVTSAAHGGALRNARVSVEGTAIATFTDEAGAYRLDGLGPGPLRLGVFHVGMERQSVAAEVRAGGVARRDVELAPAGAAAGEVVRLEKFSVVESSEMNAQALALNEQRASPTIKSVVAFDEFGDRGYENVGEFLHFLPGVAVNVDGDSGPDGVSIRGFPGTGSSITLDGGSLAGARGNSRRLDLSEVPLANLSRIEITKVPTPDSPAEGLGGTINLITQNGFERRKPTFTYGTSLTLHSTNELRLKWPRHHIPKNSPRYTLPAVDFSYSHPIGDTLAISIGGAHTWRLKAMDDSDDSRDETPNWDQVRGIQRTSDWASRVQQYVTKSGQAGLDWRLGRRHSLSADVYYKDYSMVVTRNNLAVDFGAGATGDARFTQGAATAAGQVNQQTGTWYAYDTKTAHGNLSYGFKADGWRVDAIGSWSRSNFHLHDTENGHFRTAPARISDLIIRGNDIAPKGIPRRFQATTRTGAPVDLYNGSLYSILSATSAPQHNFTINQSGRLDVTRQFGGAIDLALKAGAALDRRQRDLRTVTRTWNFRPNGATDVASRLASRFDVFDEGFLAGAEGIYGVPFRAISQRKVYQLWQQRPEWFALDEPAAYQSAVTGSREFRETIGATYLRGDVRLWQNRLWIVGGVRFERTETSGRGPLDDINAQYQRDARGNFIRNAAGQRVLITTDALALRKLRYTERGARGGSDYEGFYPSLNATYSFSERALVRAAYARTIGRPDTAFIIPGTTISEPDAANPTITVSNIGLKPWTADGLDLSFELYDFKGGSGSVGVFHKGIRDFFGSVRQPVTPARLEEFGLANDGSFANYEIATQENAGRARITGYEFSYRQALTFLPVWARGFQVFVNATKMELSGGASADFGDFNPLKYSGGINFIRPRYAVKLTYSHQDETRREAVAPSAANGIPAGTYNYREAYSRWGVHAQYGFSRRVTAYMSLKDLGGLTIRQLRYAPETPDFARGRRLQQLGYYLTLGLKGTF